MSLVLHFVSVGLLVYILIRIIEMEKNVEDIRELHTNQLELAENMANKNMFKPIPHETDEKNEEEDIHDEEK